LVRQKGTEESKTKTEKKDFPQWLVGQPRLTSTFSLLTFEKVGNGSRAPHRAQHLHVSHNAGPSWAGEHHRGLSNPWAPEGQPAILMPVDGRQPASERSD